MKKQLVVLTIIFTLLLTGCSDDKREQETVSGLFSVPYSFSLDKQSLEFSQNDLIIPFFSYDRDCLSEKYPIEQTYIRSKDGAKILETTIAFEHEPGPLMQLNGRNLYGGTMRLDIEFLPVQISNAELVIEYQNKTPDSLEIGSLALADLVSDTVPKPDDCIAYVFLHAVTNDHINSVLKVNSIALEIKTEQEINIQKIDFGVPGIGIAADDLKIFHDADADRVLNLVKSVRLNEEISDAYDRRQTGQPDKDCNLVVGPGRYVIICPLTYQSDSQPDVKKIFVRLDFVTEHGKSNYSIPTFPLYSIFRYPPEQLLRLTGQSTEH